MERPGFDEVIGRGDELVAIERLLERATEAPGALVFEGEPGIGKTALWESARAAAGRRGFRVLASRPGRADAQLALAGFGDLFSVVPSELVESLPVPQRRALDVALLRAEPERDEADQRTLSVATLRLLGELAAERPLLLAIDDAQWLDESSAAILAFVARRLGGSPVGLALTLRSGAD